MTETIYGAQPPKPERGAEAQRVTLTDVQQFVQTQREIDQLQVVLQVAQDETKEQLKRGRIPGKKLSLSFQPSKSAPLDSPLYLAQWQQAAQIQSLIDQVQIMKSSFSEEVVGMEGQLKQVAKAFPKLSESDLDTLNNVFNKLHTLANHAEPETQVSYWEEVSQMYFKMHEAANQYLAKGSDPRGEIANQRNQLGKAAMGAAAKKGQGGGAIANDFKHAILDHYMKNQEKYLMALSEMLMFDNMGASIGNQLLSMTTGFGAASSDFDFSNSLHGNGKWPPYFTGSPLHAKQQLTREKSRCQADYKAAQKALAKIESEIRSIRNNPNLSAKQKKQMIGRLQKLEKTAQATVGQMKMFWNFLKNVTVGGTGTRFVLYYKGRSWTKANANSLSTFESVAINGNSAAAAKTNHLPVGGGLSPLSSDINVFQQYYADQGQNQQLILQMRMTEIQQEWTLISTVLGMMNRMYMTIAQGIKPG